MSRVYAGRFGVHKAYRGNKAINLNLSKDQAILLNISILNALSKGCENLDIAIFDSRKQKKAGKIPAGTIPATVTFASN